ncbi:PEPxxWA-CTERM sorting domain-containing protein [Sphingomonas sp. ID1715]|uniref:PEPxxWA-CTERM sorting domain-containing protein n=1 Tax=Sphingomonas sp. ID1715 TaxID=1656898 RepID=UPI00148935E9|nr:PEPxxWA-CTERM sorting domain-containing protein [Sphingomonas sp. ID1715]NNM76100.1 PEPxxWA-CTERM sorting domain-containing protein [Sphingomonas sp. ID1715]
MKQLLFAGAALLLSSGAQAVTYDAFETFNGVQRAGNFAWTSAENQVLTPLASVDCVINNTICLGLPGGAFNLPGVFKSTGIPSTSHPYQPLDRLLVHPGASSSLIGFFFAPTAGEYSFEATLDALTSGTSVGIFALTDAGGVTNVFANGFLGTLGASRTFTGTFDLAAGEVIGIGVNNAGGFGGDSTGLRFVVTQNIAAVPEPAAWAMMIGGFALAGTAARRRTTRIVFA